MSDVAGTGALTVVTVVRNAAGPLEQTIESLVPFLAPGVDYIIVDGGSTDGTREVIQQHQARLKAWHSAPDLGVYDAMNRGWEKADPASRILYLGAGDRLLALPRPEELAGDPKSIIYGKVELAGGQLFLPRAGGWLRLYNSLHHQALLIPKALHPSPPFDLAFPRYADFDFNQRLLKQGARFRFSATFRAYAAPGGLTQDLVIDELAAVTNKNFGPVWSGLARLGYALSQHCSLIHRLRPIR